MRPGQGPGSTAGHQEAMDAMSEVSEGTTGTGASVTGRYSEELHEFAQRLGLASADMLSHERFRVDRRRLEAMLRVQDDTAEPADVFFQRIMDETCTYISWPSKLKIGAKSKKDPHIRISGKEDDVIEAKDRVVAVLDTKGNRVTMKLDVSYTDHSHIIGRGGLTIKSVMENTNCHIHFPDSNRSNPNEKSNQVSIAGEIDGVERARARVRELTPLIFSFELPTVSSLSGTPDELSPFIASVQDSYNVQVMFRTRPKLHSTLVLVKGCEWELARVKEATMLLVKHMCDSLSSQVTIHMMMEISPQHHSIVVGRNHENLKQIIMRTGAKILFPDATDPNIPPIKRSNVTISGGINNVYLARQQLIGMLPLLLVFDVPEHSVTTSMSTISEIMNSLEVVIQMRNKPKQNAVSVTIKGLEKNATNIYEARRQLLGSKEPGVIASIPPEYSGLSAFNNHSCNMELVSNVFLPHCQSPLMVNSPGPVPQLLPAQQLWLQHLMPSSAARNSLAHSLSMPDIAGTQGYSSLSSNTSPLSSPCASPRNASPSPSHTHNLYADHKSDQSNVSSDPRAPGYDRYKSALDYQTLKLQAAQAVQGQPKSSDLRVPTSSWSGFGFSQSSPSAVLKEQKQRGGINSQARDIWTSSQNTFYSAAMSDMSSCSSPDLTGGVGLSASNYLDCLPRGVLSSLSAAVPYSDLPTLLASLGLDQYTQIFKAHQIDLVMFRTLNEADLKEIGVSAFGPRRKMLLCISELNKRGSLARCSAVVGAERKNSSSSNSINENWSS